MKYEMIFGDASLFDGAPDDCFCVAKNVYDNNVFYKAVDACLFWLDGEKWKPLQFMSCTPISMRRIIKEPKRWTVEDKKAGRLPEVGSIVVSTGFNEKCEFLGVGMVNGFFVVRLPNGLISINSASSFNPIETPTEKAQREEDEFVESTCRQNEPHSTLYSDGVRAAYRKLKGGE